MATYLEDYLDSVVTLPLEVKRHFELMRVLDKASTEVMKELKELHKSFLWKARLIAIELKSQGKSEEAIRKSLEENDVFQELKSKRQIAVQKLDEKIAIARQTYDIVDHHIRRLDTDLSSYETFLRQNEEFEEVEAPPVQKKRKLQHSVVPIPQEKTQTVALVVPSTGRKRAATETTTLPPVAIPIAAPPEESFIDPNEPLFCVCQRVSFGQMICCDNQDCQYEWFHFECVGLTSQPTGTWYCPSCQKLGYKA